MSSASNEEIGGSKQGELMTMNSINYDDSNTRVHELFEHVQWPSGSSVLTYLKLSHFDWGARR